MSKMSPSSNTYAEMESKPKATKSSESVWLRKLNQARKSAQEKAAGERIEMCNIYF